MSEFQSLIKKLRISILLHLSHSHQAYSPSLAWPKSSATSAVGAESSCVICLQSSTLSQRLVRPAACQHLFHEACFVDRVDATIALDPECPICQAPASRIFSHCDDATHSYVHKIAIKDLSRAEPLISAPMIFDVADCQHPVLVSLAFTYSPSVCARPLDASMENVPPEPGCMMSVVTDKRITMLSLECNKTFKRKAVTEITDFYVKPLFYLGKIKSYMLQKAMTFSNYLTGYPANPQLPEHLMSFVDRSDQEEGPAITFSPGVPLSYITFCGNTFSLLSHILTFGNVERWMFPNPQQVRGELLTCINFPRRSMDLLPTLGGAGPGSSAGEDTCDRNTSDDAEEEASALQHTRFRWQSRLKLDLLVSYSPDGRDPFARLSDITFRSGRLSGCLKDCLVMDQVNTRDSNFRRYEQDYHRGIQALDDDGSSIYVHLSAR